MVEQMNRNELALYITETYGAQAEYPFMQYPDAAVFRHSDNRKWFAVIMSVSERKLGGSADEIIDIINLKCDPVLSGSLRLETGIYPAYHMNKEKWISVSTDKADEDKIKWLIDISFELTASRRKK